MADADLDFLRIENARLRQEAEQAKAELASRPPEGWSGYMPSGDPRGAPYIAPQKAKRRMFSFGPR